MHKHQLFKQVLLLVISLLTTDIAIAQIDEHLIIFGQSLSTGQQSWPPLTTESISGNYMIGNQVWINRGNSQSDKLFPLVANVSNSTRNLAKSRASQAEAECPVVGMSNHLQMVTGQKYRFIATSCGYGGKTIEELSKQYYNPVYYGDYIKALTEAQKISPNIHCPAIIWMQGEYNYTQRNRGLTQNAENVTDKEGYKDLFLKLKEDIQRDLLDRYNQLDKPVFITYQTRGFKLNKMPQSLREMSISMAQLELANENCDVICAGPNYQMTDRGTHLDPNGYRWYGEMLAKVYYKTVIKGERFSPLQPIEIARTDNPKKLRLRFHVPCPPLKFDTDIVPSVPAMGFLIYLNGGETPETLQATIEGDAVYLTATRDLTGTIEVAYGTGMTYGNGNLRDSDPYQARYHYVDLDKKDESGNYIYERDATETTLRPAFEPKDANGIIYDKPYPLYNFCVGFYYKLAPEQQTISISPFQTATNQSAVNVRSQVRLKADRLEISGQKHGISNIEIFDSFGKLIKRFTQTNDLSFSKLPKGLYFVKIQGMDVHEINKQIVN